MTNECLNCDKHWEDDELQDIEDFWCRVDAGELCPSGECPECGSLVHRVSTTVEERQEKASEYLTWAFAELEKARAPKAFKLVMDAMAELDRLAAGRAAPRP